MFNLLGTFTFNAGTSHSIDLTDEANGFVIADSVQVVSVGAGPNMATWQPMLTQAGEYEVFAKWTSHMNRATNAKYTIIHTSGTDTITVNQQTNGGTFNSLGAFTLDSNSNVQLTDVADGFVIADAIKIVRTSTPPPMTVAGVFFYHTDHLGTPQLLTDNTQTVVWKADYDPFGSATVTVETIENNLRFPGQYFDQETGLHYNYFRYYDPDTGRYMTSDPIGLEGGLNTYSYALENPINLIDPNGLTGRDVDGSVSPIGRVLADIINAITSPKQQCRFLREVYHGGPCKTCWYQCPGFGAPVTFPQAFEKPCPPIGDNGLVDTSFIDPKCRPGGQCDD